MTRRRIILATLVLLLTTFVIAVQHDTFVRRWCLPAPPPATRPIGPLDQGIDEFVVDDRHAPETLRELERRSGVRISVGRGMAYHFGVFVESRPRRHAVIRRATVDQLLSRIVAPLASAVVLDDPLTLDADRTVNLESAGEPRVVPTTIRVHDVDRALLQPGVEWTRFPRDWGVGPEPQVALVTTHLERRPPIGHQKSHLILTVDPVYRFGDRLIVLTTPRNHWLISQLLREEAEAQHANRNQPAATLPAK